MQKTEVVPASAEGNTGGLRSVGGGQKSEVRRQQGRREKSEKGARNEWKFTLKSDKFEE